MAVPGDPSLARLHKRVSVHDDALGRDYAIFADGSGLYQSESATAPDGHEIFRDTRRVRYTLGAGENGISYLVGQNGYLFEAPLSYYTKTRTWGLSPGYSVDYGFDRLAQTACIVCHSGLARPVAGRDGRYKDPPFKQLSIGCENCHGPGSLHVEERLKGLPLRGSDRSIVNPAELPGWLANNLCMTCHERGDARVMLPGKTYMDRRPGVPLDRTVAIFAVPFTRQSPPQSPHLQQYTQMVLSKCYRASGGRLKCITCHDPHVEATAAEAPAYYRAKCLQCHTVRSCALPLAQRLRQSPPDNCIGCHMPKQNLEHFSHSSLTNHRIIARAGEPFPEAAFHMTTPGLPDLVYVNREPGKTGSPVDPLIRLQAYRDLMTIYPQYREAESKLLDQLAKVHADNPFVLSALGQRAMMANTPESFSKAQADLKRAIATGSESSSDLDLYGRLLIHSGSMAEAARVLERDVSLYPYSSERYKMLAFAYIKLGKYRHALDTMRKELQLFPQDTAARAFIARVAASFAASPE